jgi:hypothetical protein
MRSRYYTNGHINELWDPAYQKTDVEDSEKTNIFYTDNATYRCTSNRHETEPDPAVHFTAPDMKRKCIYWRFQSGCVKSIEKFYVAS